MSMMEFSLVFIDLFHIFGDFFIILVLIHMFLFPNKRLYYSVQKLFNEILHWSSIFTFAFFIKI